MSRFKLFGLLVAMLAATNNDRTLTIDEKNLQSKAINKQFGGMQYSALPKSSPYNQRQRRKLERQVPQRRNLK